MTTASAATEACNSSIHTDYGPCLTHPVPVGSLNTKKTDMFNNRQPPHNSQAVVPKVAQVRERPGIVSEAAPSLVPTHPSANVTDTASFLWREGVAGPPELLTYLADRVAGVAHAALLLVKRILSVLFGLVVIVVMVVAGLLLSGQLSGADLAAIIQAAVPY